jgi:hypothetical protein
MIGDWLVGAWFWGLGWGVVFDVGRVKKVVMK